MTRGRARAALAAALALGMGLRVSLLALTAGEPSRLMTLDGQGYLSLARDLRGGYLDAGSPLFAVGLLYPPPIRWAPLERPSRDGCASSAEPA